MKDEMDMLREVGSIAAAHGSIALSSILERKIEVKFPDLEVFHPADKLTDMKTGTVSIAIFSKILTGLKGSVAFVLDEKNAFKIIDLSCDMSRDRRNPGLLTELGLSVIKEIGNVVISSYLNSLSLILRRVIIPPLPSLISGSLEDILKIILNRQIKEEYVYFIRAFFREPRTDISGYFYLILNSEAVKDIRSGCKKLLEEIS